MVQKSGLFFVNCHVTYVFGPKWRGMWIVTSNQVSRRIGLHNINIIFELDAKAKIVITSNQLVG
jgi:hypothetical protein